MFEPVRGGTRGGQAEFKWSDVSADKDRENYLGHSVNAPTGRWQKNKDVHWYNRDVAQSAFERAEEVRKVKEAEAEALAVALGFAPAAKISESANSTSPSASAIARLASTKKGSEVSTNLGKEERTRRKMERKEEKRVKKEKKLAARREINHGDTRRLRDQSRSRSPARHSFRKLEATAVRLPRSRSRTPPLRRQSRSPSLMGYDAAERDMERERDRQRWDMDPRRDRRGDRWSRR